MIFDLKKPDSKDFSINNVYRVKKNNKNFFVYEGLCNNIPTKWITKSIWNYKIIIYFDDKKDKIRYKDDKNKEILVYENDEENWNNW